MFKRDLARGEQLFAARAYGAAREQFAAIQGLVSGDSRELVDLRLAECDYFTKKTRAARAAHTSSETGSAGRQSPSNGLPTLPTHASVRSSTCLV